MRVWKVLTEILDGGVNGVAAVQKEVDEQGTDGAAAAGDTHHLLHFAT